jgi:branched-subunit amino acid transport protein
MTTNEFLLIYGLVLVTMLCCRVIPLFVLKGRELSPRAREAIGLIPPAAFAALVANDILDPATLFKDPVKGLLPIAASVPVLIVARLTKSLIASALVGMLVYAVLLYLPTFVG